MDAANYRQQKEQLSVENNLLVENMIMEVGAVGLPDDSLRE
jgi:hypothetical protein